MQNGLPRVLMCLAGAEALMRASVVPDFGTAAGAGLLALVWSARQLSLPDGDATANPVLQVLTFVLSPPGLGLSQYAPMLRHLLLPMAMVGASWAVWALGRVRGSLLRPGR